MASTEFVIGAPFQLKNPGSHLCRLYTSSQMIITILTFRDNLHNFGGCNNLNGDNRFLI